MDLDALRLLVEVGRRGSFAAVARDHGTEPSSVSRAIAGLEQELGFRILQRTTRRMAPTEAGALYLQRAEKLLEDLDAARDEARASSGGPTGVLRLTASMAFGTTRIVPLLSEFRQTYPAIDLDLIFTDETLDLVDARIDLAIRLAPSVEANVIGTRLMTTRYRVCAAPDYLARVGRPPTPLTLGEHDCLLFALAGYRSHWQLRDAAGIITVVPVSGGIVTTSALAIFTAAKQGLGPALLPDWLVDDAFADGTLVDVFPDHDAAATSFDTSAWLLYPSRSFVPNKVRVAIDFLKARLGRRTGR